MTISNGLIHRSILTSTKTLGIFTLALASTLLAQPVRSTNRMVQTPPSEDLKISLELFYSYSPESDLSRDGKVGDVAVERYDLKVNASKRASADTNVFFGVFDKYTNLELSDAIQLPDTLHAIELSLGAQKNLQDWFGPGWRGSAMFLTEFSNDSSGLSGAEAIFGGIMTLGYQQSPTLLWTFGIIGRSEGDIPALPALGVRWSFAPKWTLSVGVPTTGVIYAHSERLSIQAGLSFFDGLYHVSNGKTSDLDDTWLEHEELRVGLRVDCRLSKHLELTAGAGVAVEREFDYYDRNYSIEGDTAGFLTIGLGARF